MSRIISGKLRLDVQPLQPVVVHRGGDRDGARRRPTPRASGSSSSSIPAAGPISGDPEPPAAGGLEPALERHQVHAEGRQGAGACCERVELARRDHASPTPASASSPSSCRTCSSASARPTPRRRARHGGLGLGLSIVKHLVELHGGTVRRDEPGRGPGHDLHRAPAADRGASRHGDGDERAHPTAPPSRAVGLRRRRSSPGIKVLVVDDEADARELIKRVLEDCGAERADRRRRPTRRSALVEARAAGRAGQRHRHARRRRLRAAAPGARARARRAAASVPAIALTAFARSEDRTRALRAGFLVHVAKPVEPAELVATVASVAGRGDAHTG